MESKCWKAAAQAISRNFKKINHVYVMKQRKKSLYTNSITNTLHKDKMTSFIGFLILQSFFKSGKWLPGVEAHTCNSSVRVAEAGRLLVYGQPKLPRDHI